MFRSARHEEAYRLRTDKKLTLEEIGAQLGVSSEAARMMVKMAKSPRKEPGVKPKPVASHRLPVTVRLPQEVIAALNQAFDENATTMTNEIEARLVESLIADGLLGRDIAKQVCGKFAALVAAIS